MIQWFIILVNKSNILALIRLLGGLKLNSSMSYKQAQMLFMKVSFYLKQTYLDIEIPAGSKESVKLLTPFELYKSPEHIGTIQYGGVHYPQSDINKIEFQYVELRLKGNFLKEIRIYNDVSEIMEEVDGYGWLKHKLYYNTSDLMLVRKIAILLMKGLEAKYQLDYLSIGIDKSILGLPRLDTDVSPNNMEDKASEEKIGLLVRKTMDRFSRNHTLSPEKVMLLTDEKYSKDIFDINYAFLVKVDKNVKADQRLVNGYPRYWSNEIILNGEKYYMCNDWYERNRGKFLKWVRNFSSS